MKKWHELIGSVFYIGKSPRMPGTLGSGAGLLLLWGVSFVGSQYLFPANLALTFFLFFLGRYSSKVIVQYSGQNDPQQIVIDEVVGILVTFILVPLDLTSVILGFLYFRVFDIWKPYPIRKLEILPNGWGVMLDDVLAGVYANLLLHLSLFVWK